MVVKFGKDGATLVELVIAAAMLCAAVVAISLVFPSASKNLSNNRHRFLANNYASDLMEQTKAKLYHQITPTEATTGNFPVSLIGEPNGCNCSSEDLQSIVVHSSYTADSLLFIRRVCVNLVERNVGGSTWESHCPDDPLTSARDKGLKNIRVRVDWGFGQNAHSTQLDSMVTR